MKGEQRGVASERYGVAAKRTPPATAQGPKRACVADEELNEGVTDGDLHEAAKDGAFVLGAGTVDALQVHVACLRHVSVGSNSRCRCCRLRGGAFVGR